MEAGGILQWWWCTSRESSGQETVCSSINVPYRVSIRSCGHPDMVMIMVVLSLSDHLQCSLSCAHKRGGVTITMSAISNRPSTSPCRSMGREVTAGDTF